MQQRQLGKTGPKTSALGLGAMGMSGMYGPADSQESIATIHAALDAGVTLIDTGDFYGMGHNEMLIGEALKGVPRDRFQLSVKFGAMRDPVGGWGGVDARPAAVKNFLAYTLQRLGVDHIDIYRPARLDPNVPIEETVGAIADMVKAGYISHIGLSEVGAETIRRAAAVHPICDLQIEYSLISRGIEDEILAATRALGIGITAYGVLSRGLISGHWRSPPQRPAGRGARRARSDAQPGRPRGDRARGAEKCGGGVPLSGNGDGSARQRETVSPGHPSKRYRSRKHKRMKHFPRHLMMCDCAGLGAFPRPSGARRPCHWPAGARGLTRITHELMNAATRRQF